jgi:hypothetical protein
LAIRHADEDFHAAEQIIYLLLEAGAQNKHRDYLGKRPIDYIYDLSDERQVKKLLSLFKQFGFTINNSLVPLIRVRRRYLIAGTICVLFLLFIAFLMPNIPSSGLKFLFMVGVFNSLASGIYTYAVQSRLPCRT